jgi:hypothetical protein
MVVMSAARVATDEPVQVAAGAQHRADIVPLKIGYADLADDPAWKPA